ncbi:MAG: sulfate ABC transporter ATP-binding protein [Candidatus Eremiobacteraeota bacterium]|nr:sulfate ABC transporter ATP-binding protein [Candidatus Eremiobacteraeota bacterium]MBV8499911.1 sulfate ABC transporter ATP-binding protein [Candidatus Eremiobacteraeota bacterium]
MSITVQNITKRFGTFTALEGVSLDIPSGRLVALLGPSGSGKTTLLRIIAGLEVADTGVVRFDGEDFSTRTARERRVGFVFQHYALFRHMTVFENIAFGLRVRPRGTRPSGRRIRVRVTELLELIGLQNQAGRYPSQLSGGQRQRVALARALAVEPSVLLLDEPFGALDAKVRLELRRWLRQLHDEVGVTSVFVTHDQDEALEVADQVAVMNCGRVEQVGSPEEVYHRPATSFVYNFLGNVNLFHGRVDDGTAYIGAEATGHLVFVRPHALEVARRPVSANFFRATTKHINAAGPVVKVEAVTEWGAPVRVEMAPERFRELALRAGEEIFVTPRDPAIFTNNERAG